MVCGVSGCWQKSETDAFSGLMYSFSQFSGGGLLPDWIGQTNFVDRPSRHMKIRESHPSSYHRHAPADIEVCGNIFSFCDLIPGRAKPFQQANALLGESKTDKQSKHPTFFRKVPRAFIVWSVA
jgi:hypothetical protein